MSDIERIKRMRKEKYKAKMGDPNSSKHGTRTGYVYGCRCARCRAAVGDYYRANKDAIRESKERRLAQMQSDPDDKRHGTYTGYIYGCRCDACRAEYRRVKVERGYDRAARK